MNNLRQNKLSFINFTKLKDDELLEILKLRNSEYIRHKMLSSKKISLEEHLSFCHSLRSDSSRLYLKVLLNNNFIGVIDFQNIDEHSHSYIPGDYFVNDECYKNIAYYAILASTIICIDKKYYYPKISVKKDNLQALIFNTMKFSNYITGENEDCYFLTNDSLNPDKVDLSKLREAIISELTKQFELEFIL